MVLAAPLFSMRWLQISPRTSTKVMRENLSPLLIGLAFNVVAFVLISMYGNNIKFAAVGIGVVVAVTLLTLGRLVIPNFALPVLAQITQQNGTNSTTIASASAEPITINDSNLKAEVVFKGIDFPTSMAFLGPDDILVLEKNNGIVRRIVNGTMLPEPLLDVSVANKNERGMLGIAVSKNENKTNVFLYYTESGGKNGNDDCPTPTLCKEGNDPLGNRLYRYDLVDNKLVNPNLLLDLPAKPGPAHNGGKIVIGPDSNLYLGIGELTLMRTQASNYQTGLAPDGRGGILRVTQDGQVVGGEKGILGNSTPLLNLYYAYGIRNSFGMDFDPITGKLWDSENGPACCDEINLEPIPKLSSCRQ